MKDKYWLEAEKIDAYKNGFKVINNLSVKFVENQRIILLGPNGSGKSSIVDLINRNIYPLVKNNSEFKIFNRELIDIWEVRKYISTVNNEIRSRINPNLKVIDLVISGLYGKYCKITESTKKDFIKANEFIEKICSSDISQRKFGYLSDGEKQISLIARALINNPKVLILDEPSVNIDLKSKLFLIKKIHDLKEMKINVLCITHDISLITKDYDRVIFLKDRKVYKDGDPRELMKTRNINNLFDINIKIIENSNSWDVIRS